MSQNISFNGNYWWKSLKTIAGNIAKMEKRGMETFRNGFEYNIFKKSIE